ncbi:hypothetical protein CVD25_07095 [Bacillus canaveralius]|uniref:Uncharacterized protein n=1 Tax=Bacillus canaveralius TaxID=1403243 RepID=A0A2N5GHD4_9BACI|nr:MULTISPECIES: hypothetical protein [Bacillus]PLR80179.1 hypothetical protein CU635_19440 [Bacillus canaveralius]PLR83849.1 hypothetical protein CVD23_13300 [Bacillus sp. V33-4]PLR98678.1 hypothetical protein CVD25_07095 [Bacillus canaveralius]RSK48178.1 hypothetical protein EJA13_16940 [Bacillus canaveralius]
MIRHILAVSIVVIIILLLERKNLKKATKITRTITIGILLISAALQVYILNNPDHVNPSMWLHFLLEPFDPIS